MSDTNNSLDLAAPISVAVPLSTEQPTVAVAKPAVAPVTITSNITSVLSDAHNAVLNAQAALATVTTKAQSDLDAAIENAKTVITSVQQHVTQATGEIPAINSDIGKFIARVEADVKNVDVKIVGVVDKEVVEIKTEAVSFFDWLLSRKVKVVAK